MKRTSPLVLAFLVACTPAAEDRPAVTAAVDDGENRGSSATGDDDGGATSGSADSDVPSGGDDTGVPACDLQCPADEVCTFGAMGPLCACDPASCAAPESCGDDGHCQLVWPNEVSSANSDPWISEHHAEIEQMRPRVLALNYVNARSMEDMSADLGEIISAMDEASRYHGYVDASAPPFLRYEVAYSVDLRDPAPPADYPYHNSSLFPRENPADGYWSFDYEMLFTEAYAQHLGIENPYQPGDKLQLCEAIDLGLVHEVWIYGDADVPDVSAAEVLERKPMYDENRVRIPGQWDRCAGNGCFDEEDDIPCERMVRIAFVNNTRGPGCLFESLSHGFEGMGRRDGASIPYLSRYFSEFSGMDLDLRYGTPFRSWYSCPYGMPCLSYPGSSTVHYDLANGQAGTIDGYDPVCGNVHWAPNATMHYDLSSPASVLSSCTHWRDGSGATELFDASIIAQYADVAPDCQGAFLVWWWQNVPGRHASAIDDDGGVMLSWWPFFYY